MEIEVKSLVEALPKRIQKLGVLAYNLWWTWQPDAQALFYKVEPLLWEQFVHNPVKLLRALSPASLNLLAKDATFLAEYDRVIDAFEAYLDAYAQSKSASATPQTWFSQNYAAAKWSNPVAYFSMEYGVFEVLPLYAGGLGVLSGDHLKESSDIGLPLIGVGFIYQYGYFKQRITEDGWQEADYPAYDFSQLPVTLVRKPDGTSVTVSARISGREVTMQAWKAQIGRVPLYLLDTNLPQNSEYDRSLTQRLYVPDPDKRIDQEWLLGVGGVRLLRALGVTPAVWHMNEGHPAFLTIERARELVAAGHTFADACDVVRKNTVFTTHTPVPAGNDAFAFWQIERHLNGIWNDLDITRDEFFALADQQGSYGMTVLALRMAARANGVSKLHGEVANDMWKWMYDAQNLPAGSVIPTGGQPIHYITNGVHCPTWIPRRAKRHYAQYLGDHWLENIDDQAMWQKIHDMPNEELWQLRKHYKRKLATFMLERARAKWATHTVHPVQTIASGIMIEPMHLTIGFARRFPTYKRATLILRDVERLMRIINNARMPVQIIYAGKSHPHDEPGKLLIQQLYRQIKNADSSGRLVFIEDYDTNVARHMVMGVDVWLNTPRRPYEASGTSGMKASLNGAMNFSILDGWWPEAFDGTNGWKIGRDVYASEAEQDQVDAESLYSTLENEIVPLYYDQDETGIPQGWLNRAKNAIASCAPMFSTRRMLKQYIQEMYAPLV
ncbi:MAG: alpha-glucan family phosphorylase [Chloroflexota bacterium]